MSFPLSYLAIVSPCDFSLITVWSVLCEFKSEWDDTQYYPKKKPIWTYTQIPWVEEVTNSIFADEKFVFVITHLQHKMVCQPWKMKSKQCPDGFF